MHALWKLGRESFWSWNAFCFSYALQLFTSMPLSCDVCLQSSQIGAFEVKFSLTNELQNCSWFNIWDWNFKDVQIGPMVWFLSILSMRVNKLSLSWVVIYLRLDRKEKKKRNRLVLWISIVLSFPKAQPSLSFWQMIYKPARDAPWFGNLSEL